MRTFKKIALYLILLIVVAVIGITIAAHNVTLVMEENTASGMKRNPSSYITMRDGVKIAVDVWLPVSYDGNSKFPVLMRATRYGRSYNVRLMYKVMVLFGAAKKTINYGNDLKVLNDRGYVIVRVDARGSGASQGVRNLPWSFAEIADYGEVAEWIIQQPWSNGRIGAYGVSYDGNTADLIAATGHPAIKAVAPMYSYFDSYQNLSYPGGVFDEWFVKRWSAAVNNMDYNTFCKKGAFACWYRSLISDGIKPVDEDTSGSMRAAVFAARNNPTIYEAVQQSPYRDDLHGIAGIPFDDITPFSRLAEIEASGIAMNPWVGWLDAGTVNGALSRYLTLSNPQQLVIAPLTHGGKHNSDPFAEQRSPADPDMNTQYELLADFFDPLLIEGLEPGSVESQIRYYTMGEEVWKTTKDWPPKGIETQTHFLAADALLTAKGPAQSVSADHYVADRSTASGQATRWQAISGPDVFYQDLQERDNSRRVYTTAPFDDDTEITGVPVVHLYMTSSTEDCAVFAYLEDVAPDGKVTYLSEGMLRCQNRMISDETPPYHQFGAYHRHVRADIMPMLEGQVEYLNFPLFALSAQIRKGHSIRLAIAGHDKKIFAAYPADEDPVFMLQTGGEFASRIDLPLQSDVND